MFWSDARCVPGRRERFGVLLLRNLHEVVSFYKQRFGMQLTEQQQSDLVASLNSL
ncbi:MAG: hypothetical protein JO299_19040 [Gammaproteobacteria bacterium]|nr:hypothetical protein [Gammaproteobacteria bacterium]